MIERGGVDVDDGGGSTYLHERAFCSQNAHKSSSAHLVRAALRAIRDPMVLRERTVPRVRPV